MSETVQLHSRFTPDECAQRLGAAIDSQLSLFGSRPVIGRVNSSTLRLRKRIGYGNSFQTFLTASMKPHGSGTVIDGEFAMSLFTRVFMSIWFAFLAIIGGSAFVVALFSLLAGPSEFRGNAWPFLFGPPGMLIFGFLLIRFGRYFAQAEAGFLKDFIRHTLDADEPPARVDSAE